MNDPTPVPRGADLEKIANTTPKSKEYRSPVSQDEEERYLRYWSMRSVMGLTVKEIVESEKKNGYPTTPYDVKCGLGWAATELQDQLGKPEVLAKIQEMIGKNQQVLWKEYHRIISAIEQGSGRIEETEETEHLNSKGNVVRKVVKKRKRFPATDVVNISKALYTWTQLDAMVLGLSKAHEDRSDDKIRNVQINIPMGQFYSDPREKAGEQTTIEAPKADADDRVQGSDQEDRDS